MLSQKSNSDAFSEINIEIVSTFCVLPLSDRQSTHEKILENAATDKLFPRSFLFL